MNMRLVRKHSGNPYVWPTIFDEFFNDMNSEQTQAPKQTVWQPVTDVYESAEAYHIEMEVPGINKEDIKIEVKDNTLTIHGERSFENEDKEKNYTRSERTWGSFTRSWGLPKTADQDNIVAENKDGLLSITLPKKPEVQPKTIDIQVS